MKRFAVLAVCLIMIFSLAVPSVAELDEGTKLVIDMQRYYQYETEQITLAVKEQYTEWEKYLGKDIDDITFGLMYRVYYLEMKDIVSAYDTQGSFGDNITDKYYWVVPHYGKGSEVEVVRNEQTEHGWAIRRGTKYMNSIRFNYPDVGFGIAMMYENVLTSYPETDRESFRLVYDEENDMHLLYFTCEGGEYVVPYFSSKEITWATNETIYPASDFIEALRDSLAKESSLVEIPRDNGAPETIYFVYILVGSVLVACVALGAVIIANKKKKK